MSLEKFDQIISEYENKTRRMLEGLAQPRCSITRRALTSDRPRYLFADTVFKEVYRPTLREMNELREEFMKCYYSPEPGSGYLDAKDSFERLNLENTPSLEKFDQIISDYKNKTRRFFGMVEHWDSPRTLFFDDVFNGVYRFALREMNELRQEFMKCHYSPNPGPGYLEAKDSFEKLNLENQSGGKRRLKYHYNGGSPENTPSLENFDKIISDYKNKTGMIGADYEGAARRDVATDARRRSPFRRLYAEHALKIHRSEVRFALRNMNMLRQEFMKCHYSPNPGQGYLDAKDSFESRLTFEGQAGGQKFRPKKLKYKPYYGGNDAQDAENAANSALKADADNAIKEARTAALFKAVITSETPFENHNEKIARDLLDTGIDPNSRNNNQVTLLGFAVDKLKTNMVKILLEYNADPNLNCTPGPNEHGPSLPPLHMLTMNLTHLEPYDPNNNQEHALFVNEQHWTQTIKDKNIQAQKDILILLLKNGANINKYNSDHDAPIHLAIQTDNLHLVQKLLDNGANPDILDANGKSPLILATDTQHELDLAIAQLIIQANPIPESLFQRGFIVEEMVKIIKKHFAKRERNKVLTSQLAPPTDRDIMQTTELPRGRRIRTTHRDYPLISDVTEKIKSYYGGRRARRGPPRRLTISARFNR